MMRVGLARHSGARASASYDAQLRIGESGGSQPHIISRFRIGPRRGPSGMTENF
jgi:hypothetical protein